MKSEENKSFSQILREIESDTSDLRDYPDEFIHIVSNKIKTNILEAKQTVKGLRILSFISAVMFISSIIMIVLTFTYYSKADNIINEQPTKFDSLTNKILGISENDSIKRFGYIVDENNKIITYQDLIKTSNELHAVRDSLDSYKHFESIVNKVFGVKMKITPTENKDIVTISMERTRPYEKSDLEKQIDKTKPTVNKILKRKDSLK